MKHHLFIAFAFTCVAILGTGCTTVEAPPERTPPPAPSTVIIHDQRQPVAPVIAPVVAPTSTTSTVTRRSTVY